MISDTMEKMLALGVLDFNEGIITIQGRIVVFMPAGVLITFHEMLAKRFGVEQANLLLYEAGKYQTTTGSVKYFEHKDELMKVFTHLSTGDSAVEMGREVLKFSGWGDTRIEKVSDNGAKVVFRTFNSPIAEEFINTRGGSKIPVCHYMRGLLEGVVESIYKNKYNSVETSCRATGLSNECVFEFTKQ